MIAACETRDVGLRDDAAARPAIVDHGDAYMSLYGNNEALFKRVGDDIRAGDPVAAVGASGGNTDSGLYFELRHRGEPIDPLTWVEIK